MQIIESGVNLCGKLQAALLLSLSMICSRHTVRLRKYAKQFVSCSICQAALSVMPFATLCVQCHVQLCLLSSDIVLVLMQQAEAHPQLGEMMQQLAFICCFASLPPSAAEELPRSLLPAAELVAEMPQAQKQGLTELVHLIDSHLSKRVVGPTAQPGIPTAEEPSITRPASSHDLDSALEAWKARELAKGPTVPFKAYHLPAADKPASAFSQTQAGAPASTDPAEATRNLLKETLLSGQQEAPRHGDNSSNRAKSTRERLREKLNAMAAAGEGVQAAEPSAQPVSMPADQGSTFLAQLAASAMAAAPSQALGLASGPGAAHFPADVSDAPEARPAKKMGKNQRRKAAAEASKAQQPTAAAGNADSAAVQPEAATSSSSEGTASGPGSPAQVSPRPVEGDSKAATSSQESRPAQPSSTSLAEAASAHSSAQDKAEQGQAAQSDLAPMSSEAVAGGQQPESADASSKAAAREADSDNSAQASTKAAVSISKADPVQAVGKADAAQAASKAAIGDRKADTTRAAAEVAEPISAQTGSTSLAGTGMAATARNVADTSMPEAAAAQADSKADACKTEPAAAQVGNAAAGTQAGNGSAAAVAQPSSGDRAVNGANKEGTANKNTVLSQSDKAADKDTQAQLAQKADQPASSAAAVPPAGIAAHRPRVPKAVLRATAAPYTPLNPSAAVSKAKGIAMGELATPFASAYHSCTLSAHFPFKLSLLLLLGYALPACAWSCCFCLPCHELNHSSSHLIGS